MPSKPAAQQSAVQYLTGPEVRARYHVSDVTIWRWLRDEKLKFPRPAMKIKNRLFWLESELTAWERDPSWRL